MKLSKRLQHIEQMVPIGYEHIWDCCCDHGFLGASLLSKQVAKNIHFVDILPDLVSNIENKLQQFYANSSSTWKTHCIDVAELPLSKYHGNHLVIIAGVGGDLMKDLVSELYLRNPNLNIDFLLCPVHHQYAFRQELIKLDLGLKGESLVEDNKRFYEVMLVSSTGDEKCPISPVGNQIWQSKSGDQELVAKKYLDKTLNHYQRIQQGSDVEHIIKAYQAVRLN